MGSDWLGHDGRSGLRVKKPHYIANRSGTFQSAIKESTITTKLPLLDDFSACYYQHGGFLAIAGHLPQKAPVFTLLLRRDRGSGMLDVLPTLIKIMDVRCMRTLHYCTYHATEWPHRDSARDSHQSVNHRTTRDTTSRRMYF